MWRTFSIRSINKKRARLLAILWTLLIFVLCFLPGDDIPEVPIPAIDKWAHFILFGVFAFLWLCTRPTIKIKYLVLIFAVSVFLGWLVEFIQGEVTILHRTQDDMDTLADSIGGLLGILLFYLVFTWAEKRLKNKSHDIP
jgi:VanZ family protein